MEHQVRVADTVLSLAMTTTGVVSEELSVKNLFQFDVDSMVVVVIDETIATVVHTNLLRSSIQRAVYTAKMTQRDVMIAIHFFLLDGVPSDLPRRERLDGSMPRRPSTWQRRIRLGRLGVPVSRLRRVVTPSLFVVDEEDPSSPELRGLHHA